MKIILKIITLIITVHLYAQQDPHYTQYMYNMNVVNPAYAGSKDNISGSILYRQQWVGIEGAPQTATFSLHSPIGKNVGLGISAVSDKIGPVNENNLFADFSYKLNLGDDRKLLFGLKAGASFFRAGLFTDVGNGFTVQPGDNAFKENVNNVYLNLGAGVFYHTEKYYMAFSIPNFFKSTHLDVTDNGMMYQFGSESQHSFLTGGYVFDLSENTKLKPSLMVKYAFNTPVTYDISLNTLLYDKFEIGASYRLEDSFAVMANFKISKNIRIGYAYDDIVSKLNIASPSSHEFMLLFDLNLYKKVSISSRFF